MISVTLREILIAKPALESLSSIKLPIKTSYHISKLIRLLNHEINEFEDYRVKLVKKIGVDDGNGMITIPEDKKDEFGKQMDELLENTVDINLNPISLSLLADHTEMTPSELSTMLPFIDDNL